MTQKYIFNLDSCNKKTNHEVTFDEAICIIANTMLHEDVHDFTFCKNNHENECIPVTRLKLFLISNVNIIWILRSLFLIM